MRRTQLPAALTVALLAFLLTAPSPRQVLAIEDSAFFPLSEIRPGLKGVGKTVFAGDQISEFQVEILGVLRNVLAPKHDAILVHLSGANVEKTGVVAGMSGSPVYVDGKLVGAVAIAFPFAKEPYGLVTPIENMLTVAPGPDTKSAAQYRPDPPRGRFAEVGAGPPDEIRLIPDDSLPALPSVGVDEVAAPLTSIRLPLRFGGFDGNLIRQYAPSFRALGLEPIDGGLGGGIPAVESISATSGGAGGGGTFPADGQPGNQTNAAANLRPGEMVSLLFVNGDFNLSADCTVTYRKADQLYACGHQIFQAGPTDIPFAPAQVLATIPSLATSFKIDAAGSPVGSIHQDRFGAIYGVVGDHATTIPVSIRVNSALGRTEDYHFNVAQAPLLSPLIVNLAVASTVGATERVLGPTTLDLKGKVQLANGDAVVIDDVVSGEAGGGTATGLAVAAPLNYLLSSDYPGLRIEGIDLNLAVQEKGHALKLDGAWVSKSEVRPGDLIDLIAVLRAASGEAVTEKIPVRIPESVGSRMLSLTVGSGPSINALQGQLTPLTSAPRDVHQMVRALNRMRRNNRLYALLSTPASSFRLEGNEFPSPPPSLVQTFLADPAAASRMTSIATSVVGDFETKPTPYTIEGSQTLFLKVLQSGM
jgi:SpoIVB peptidase S55